jgi:N-acetylmuramoyl-L-alanine amidase
MDNSARYTYCNQQKATILVSIHHNFFDDNTVDYSTALFYKTSDKGLANSIVAAVSAQLNTTNNNIAQFQDGVLSKSIMPAAISEAFFITNTDEYSLLTGSNLTRLTDEAIGIVNGIATYFKDPAKANASVGTNLKTLEAED